MGLDSQFHTVGRVKSAPAKIREKADGPAWWLFRDKVRGLEARLDIPLVLNDGFSWFRISHVPLNQTVVGC